MRPAAEPVSSVTGQKDTVVPASERKIVFNGIDALFSFHRGSFLPALERAAAPVMRPAEDLVLTDADGQSSLEVARAVANIFLSHAAFMKMYSTYIKSVVCSHLVIIHVDINILATSTTPFIV